MNEISLLSLGWECTRMRNVLATLASGFTPLAMPNLRIYLTGQAVSLVGTWMQQTAQAWVVWELTQSSESLGINAMLSFVAFLVIGPWTGVLADRLDRRKMLIVLQSAAAVLAAVLALLVQTGLVQLWHVYTLSGLLGLVAALDLPAQQAFIGDLAGPQYVRQAVVLNTSIMNGSRMIGPSLAGWVVKWAGAPAAFWVNAFSFGAVVLSLLAIQAHQTRRPSTGKPLKEFGEGLAFIRTQPRLQDLMFFMLLMTFFGMANMHIMPAFAGQTLGGDSSTLGMIVGAAGGGALLGSLTVAPLVQRYTRPGVVMGLGAAWVAFWLQMVSWAPSAGLAALCYCLTSFGVPGVIATSQGLVQLIAPPDMKGRLISAVFMVSFGLQPFAALLVGFNAAWLGPAGAIRLNSLVILAGAALIMLTRPGFRNWEYVTEAAKPLQIRPQVSESQGS